MNTIKTMQKNLKLLFPVILCLLASLLTNQQAKSQTFPLSVTIIPLQPCPCVNAQASGGIPPYIITYQWSNGAQGPCGIGPGGAGPMTVTVTVTDSLGNVATATQVISCCHIKCPNDTTICYNVPDSAIHLSKPTLAFSPGSNCVLDSTWTNFTGPFNVGPNYVTWYGLVNGQLDSCVQTVTRNPQKVMFIGFTTDHVVTGGCINICLNGTIYFQAVPPSFGFQSLQWNFGDGNFSSTANINHQYLFPGIFTVYLTGTDECGGTMVDSVKVCVDPNAGPEIDCPSVVCAGDTATYSTNATGCTSYLWTVTNGTIIGSATGPTVQVVWGNFALGTIQLVVSGCTPPVLCNSPTIRTIKIVPSTMPVSGETIVCPGTCSDYEVDCIPGTNYTWSIAPAGAGTIVQNGCKLTVCWSPTFTGTVTVTVNYQNALTGCQETGCNGTGNLTVNVRPAFGITGPTKLCPNTTGAPFNAMNTTTNTVEPGASWIVTTPIPTVITFASTGLLNSYTWSAGFGVYKIKAIAPPNTYCNDTAYTTVEVVEIKTPGIITGQDTVCPGSTHTYTVAPNMTGVNYIWTCIGGTPAGPTTTPNNNISITWGPTPPYIITVQQQLINNPFCLSTQVSYTVYQYPPITVYPTITGTNPVCKGSTGTYSFSPGLPFNASYSWSVTPTTAGKVITGGNPATIEWLNPGPATVNLKISYCSDTTLSFPVTVNPLPAPPVITAPDTGCVGNNISFSTPPGTVSWNFGDPASGVLNTSNLASAVHVYNSPGIYTVTLTVTNVFGCTESSISKITIQDKPVVPVIISGSPASVCVGTIAGYSFTQPLFSGALYNWSLSPGSFGILTQTGPNSATVIWNAPGTDTVKVHVVSMCLDTFVTYVVTVIPNPNPVITGPFTACVNQPLTFTNNGPFASEIWNFGAGPTVSPNFTYTVAGTYTVTLTVSNGGCTATTSAQITVHPLPVAFITTPDADGCTFPFTVTIHAVNSGGYSFAWTPPSGPTSTIIRTITALTTYSVIVTNQYGCTKLSNSITFNDGNCPPGPPGPGSCVTTDTIDFTWTPPVCLTDTFTENGTALPPFNWNFDYLGATGTGVTTNYTYTYPGAYKVSVCGTATGTTFGTGVPCTSSICKMHPVVIPFDADFDVSFACAGNIMQTNLINKSLFLGVSGSYVWNWYDGVSLVPNSPTAAFPPSQPLSPGPHTLKLTIFDPVTLATCTIIKPIVVPSPIAADFTPVTACALSPTQFFDASTPPGNGAAWSWTFPGPVNSSAKNPFYTFSASGIQPVTLTVTDIYGCNSTITKNVNVFPAASSTITGNPANFIGCSVTLTASPNATYNWSISNPLVTTQVFNVLQSGYYIVTGTDANGCPYKAGPVHVIIKTPPVAAITGKPIYCPGENLDLKTTSGTGYSYVWTQTPPGTIVGGNFSTLTVPAPPPGIYVYTVTVTGANGCTATATYSIQVDSIPSPLVINPAGPVSICANLVPLVLNAPTGTGFTYSWSKTPPPPITGSSSSFNVMLSGKYSVQLKTANNCPYNLGPVDVTVCDLPPAAISGDTVYCAGENLVLQTIPGTGLTYQWSLGGTNLPGVFMNVSGANNNVLNITGITLTQGGVYQVLVTNACGCTKTASVTVIVNPNPVKPIIAAFTGPYPGTIPAPGVLCDGQLFTLKVTNAGANPGIPASNYTWSNNLNGLVIPASLAGIYDVTVVNAFGCTAKSDTIVIHPSPDLSCTPSGCYTFCDTCAPIIIPGPGGIAFYQWQKDSAGTFYPYSNTQNLVINGPFIPVPQTMIFRLIAFSAFGCSDTSELLEITIIHCDSTACHIDIICDGTNPACPNIANGTAIVTVLSGTPPYQYLWSNGQTTQTIGNLPVGTYCVTVTDANGCADSCCITLIAADSIVIITDTIYQITCDSIWGGIDIHVTHGTQPYTYNWNNGATTEDISHLEAGTYTVTVTEGGGCTVTKSAIVTVNVNCCNVVPPPLPPTITINSIVGDNCNGTGCIHATFTGCCLRYSYTYYNPCNPALSYSIAPTTDSLVFCNLYAGTYTLYVSDPCGNTVQQTVVVPLLAPPLSATIQYGNCGSTICANAAGGCPPYTYNWGGGITGPCLTNIEPCTNYIVTITDSRGCTVTRSVTAPQITFNAVQPTCCEENGRLCVNVCFGEGPYTYAWCNGSTGACAFNLPAGTCCVTVTNANGDHVTCCYTLTSPQIIPPVVTFNFSQCGSVVTPVINTFGCQPYSFHWENNSIELTRGNLSGCDSIVFTITTCDGVSHHYGIRVPNVIVNTTPITCAGGEGTACISMECFRCPPYTYTWNPGCGAVNHDSCITCTAGIYTVCITNSCGDVVCCQVSLTPVSPVTVLINSVNHPTSSLPNSGTINVSGTGGTPPYTWLWSNGSTLQNQTGLSAGTYTVTVTDANGCTATKSVTLILKCKLSYTYLVLQNASCFKNNGVAIVFPSGGTAPYTYAWQTVPVQTTATGTGLAYGVNSFVLITDANGCKILAQIVVPTSTGLGLNFVPSVYPGGKNIRCHGGNDGSINLIVTGSTGPYTYTWSNGATTQNISGLTAGTYTVTVTNGGCTNTALVILTQPAALVLNVTKTNVSCNGGSNGTATANASGGTAPYTYSWNTVPLQTNATATGLSAGTYTVTVSDVNGCTKTASVNITQPPIIVITGVQTNVKCFGGSTGLINISISGGTAPYSYLWSNGVTTKNNHGIPAGTYTITVTDSKGCTKQYSATISQPPQLTATFVKTNVSCFGGNNGTASVTASGGTPPYTYSWNTVPVKTTAAVTGLAAGNFTCTITDSQGCKKTVTINISQPTAITISITKTNVSTPGGHNGSATANVSGGTPPYLYSWNTVPVITTATAVNLSAGTYTVTVTDANGCTKTKSVTITQPAPRAGMFPDSREVNENTFGLHPNPVTEGFYVTIDMAASERVQLVIYDVSGRKILTVAEKVFEEGKHELYVGTAVLEDGLYYLSVVNENKTKVIKFNVIR